LGWQCVVRERANLNSEKENYMKYFVMLFAALALTSPHAFASATRTLDGQQITNGAAVLTLPTTTDTLTGNAATATLTNKTISGASNTLSSIPVSALASGTAIGVPTGGTGAATLTANGILQGNGTSAVSAISCGTSNAVLTWSGSAWSCVLPTATAPSLNGGSTTPESVTASGGISLTSIAYVNSVWVVGSTSATTVTKTPSITPCTADGQKLQLAGTSATNTVTLQDQANLASSGLSLNGNWVGGKDSSLSLHCDITQGLWVEDARR
jgi:hypothetical protein